MKKVNMNHWFIKDNDLSISLMRFYISIKLDEDTCNLKVISDVNNEINLEFTTLEEAVAFTEEYINSCHNLEEVVDIYNDLYPEVVHGEDKVILSPERVEQALIEYFDEGKGYHVSIRKRLFIENNQPKIHFYLVEHFKSDCKETLIQTRLTEEELMNAFKHYVEEVYEVEKFKYMGGIHHFYLDEDSPYYEGIELHVKVKEKEKTLEK